MSTITVSQEINAQRDALEPVFTALREDMTAHFWEGFGEAAAEFRRNRNEEAGRARFAGVCRELTRDAKGTANNPEYRRSVPDDVRERATVPPLAPPAERLTLPERVVYTVTGIACTLVLVWIGYLISGHAFPSDAPASPSVVPTVNVTDNGTDVQELITRGAYWSWAAADGCGRGPAECDRVMREVNGEAYPYGLRVFEDGSVSPYNN